MKEEISLEELYDFIMKKLSENARNITIIRKQQLEINKLSDELNNLKNKVSIKNDKHPTKNNSSITQTYIEKLSEREKIYLNIFRTYKKFLLRDPAPQDLLRGLQNIDSGKSLKWIEEKIKSSTEYQHINHMSKNEGKK